MDAPINVAQFAVDRRKALAQKVASMFGAKTGTASGAGRGVGYGGMNPQQHQQFTSPYMQSAMPGLGVVNAGNPGDPFGGSTDQGMPAMSPGQGPLSPGLDAQNQAQSPGPIMAPQAPMLPNILPGSGMYGAGHPAGGFYAPGSPPPVMQDAILRSLTAAQPPNPYLPYGGQAAPTGYASAGGGGSLRF